MTKCLNINSHFLWGYCSGSQPNRQESVSSSGHSGTLMVVCANHTPFDTEAGSSWFLESVQLFSKVNINYFFNSAWGLFQTCGESAFTSGLIVVSVLLVTAFSDMTTCGQIKQSTIRLRDLKLKVFCFFCNSPILTLKWNKSLASSVSKSWALSFLEGLLNRGRIVWSWGSSWWDQDVWEGWT